ncbi:MAG: TonB-dependent receptor [Idiomarina sp.]|nr:TonB-dependent receptor [Idiomarina sp.]
MMKKKPLALIVSASLLTGGMSISAMAQTSDQTSTDSHEQMERIVVTASPLDRTAIESTQPIYVLSGDYLRQVQAATLGETLRGLPGVQSTYYSPTSSSPVIRGLDGPRVRILQNGLDVGDVSRGGPDHAVSTESSTAEQIEVLRGPATLLYGSGASGGIVNVVDNRIPRQRVDGVEGQVSAGVASAANERSMSAGLRQGTGNFVLSLDGFKRQADDYRVPEFITPDGDRSTLIENSFTDDIGGTIGASFVGDRGFFGASYGRIERDYGIPGHSHDHGDDDHGHDHGHDDHDDHDDDGGIFANMVQDRYQILGQLNNPLNGLERINLNFGYTELQHEEIEDGFVESGFGVDQTELRITARHQEIAGWRGAFGVQLKREDYVSYGVEAFTPDTRTDLAGVFWLTERTIGDITYELGARAEYVELDTDGLASLEYAPVSASAGVNYRLSDELNMTANLAYSERAPQSGELFSNGAHFATRTFDIGGIYEIHEEHEHDDHGHDHGDEYHLAFADYALGKEKSANLDLGMHYDGVRWHFDANLFYNRIDDFIYARNTGILSSQLDSDMGLGGHDDHGHDHDHSHDDSGFLVYQYTQADAELYGYEVSAHYLLNDEWRFGAFSDYTRAKLRSGGNIPRIPAQRTGLDVTYSQQSWDAKLSYTQYWAQNDVAENEAPTDSFGILSAYLNFYPQTAGQQDIAFYLKAENLTNRLGYVHNSFIRDYAPMPGMNIGAGVRISF